MDSGEIRSGTEARPEGSAYTELEKYITHSHETCRLIIKIGLISFCAFPIVLYILLAITSGNKVVALLIWIVAMFILALVLILVGYFDKRMQDTLENLRGEEYSLGRLRLVNTDYLDRQAERQEEKLEEFEEIVKDARDSLGEKMREKSSRARNGKTAADETPDSGYSVDDILSDYYIEEEMEQQEDDQKK